MLKIPMFETPCDCCEGTGRGHMAGQGCIVCGSSGTVYRHVKYKRKERKKKFERMIEDRSDFIATIYNNVNKWWR